MRKHQGIIDFFFFTIIKNMIPKKLRGILEHQHYKIVGNHSAVKVCHWTKKSILDEGFCYKQKFYGIESHRCLQMTPAVAWCTHRCVFCWRNIEHTIGTEMQQYDEPGDIIDNAIDAQRILLSGFGGIPERVNHKKFKEAQNPNQAAISLSGEPTIYPKIGGLIEEFNKRKFTTFLVTNGTLPGRLKNLGELPTQLYLSLDAPNEKTYERIDNPIIPNGWDRIMETVALFPSLETRKAIRLTMVRNWNLGSAKEYALLIDRSQPDWVEVKAYMFVGASRQRMNLDDMPSFDEITGFSKELERESGYEIKDFKQDSRVVLLGK